MRTGTPLDSLRIRRESGAVTGLGAARIVLRELVAQGGCALLCFERDPAKCHRSILAEVLAKRSGSAFRIEHLGLNVEKAAQGDLFGPERDARPEE